MLIWFDLSEYLWYAKSLVVFTSIGDVSLNTYAKCNYYFLLMKTFSRRQPVCFKFSCCFLNNHPKTMEHSLNIIIFDPKSMIWFQKSYIIAGMGVPLTMKWSKNVSHHGKEYFQIMKSFVGMSQIPLLNKFPFWR